MVEQIGNLRCISLETKILIYLTYMMLISCNEYFLTGIVCILSPSGLLAIRYEKLHPNLWCYTLKI